MFNKKLKKVNKYNSEERLCAYKILIMMLINFIVEINVFLLNCLAL